MKTEKQGFVVLYSWLPKLRAMGGNKGLAILGALAELDQTGELPAIGQDISPLEQEVINDMIEVVAENRGKYLEKCETNRLNGALGGRPKTQKNRTVTDGNRTKPNVTQRNPKKPDKDIDIDKDIYISRKKNKFHNFDQRDNSEIIAKIEERGII